MSYVDQSLLQGEKIVFRTKKHYIIFSVPFIFLLLALAFTLDNHVTRSINTTFSSLFQYTHFAPYVARVPTLLFTLAAIFTGFKQWLIYATSDYAVTDLRVIMKEGFFDRYICDTRLTTISHVTVEQPLLGQALHYGSIVINGFGGNRDIFLQIALPNEFQKSVQSQLLKITK